MLVFTVWTIFGFQQVLSLFFSSKVQSRSFWELWITWTVISFSSVQRTVGCVPSKSFFFKKHICSFESLVLSDFREKLSFGYLVGLYLEITFEQSLHSGGTHMGLLNRFIGTSCRISSQLFSDALYEFFYTGLSDVVRTLGWVLPVSLGRFNALNTPDRLTYPFKTLKSRILPYHHGAFVQWCYSSCFMVSNLHAIYEIGYYIDNIYVLRYICRN